MKYLWLNTICGIMIFTQITQCKITDRSFPKNFSIGASTSSYQIEGAWNISGKGESIMDWYTHTYPERSVQPDAADIACDSYYNYLEDVKWIKDIGLDHYRFSISWSRILPTGFANNINKDGIRYYKSLIEALLANGIEPLVTLYHWEHPQILEDMGGWTNELMVQWYADYARVIFEEFGPMVKTFMTINEPTTICVYGYNTTLIAPGKVLENMGEYLCAHNILKAHATVYHMYHDEYRSTQKGEIGIATNCMGWVPGENTTDQSIDQYFQFNCGWIMHPIYIGDYPEIMRTRIAWLSESEGREYSRLPIFSQEWIEYIKGTSDFFGLNHYTSVMPVFENNDEFGKYSSDSGVIPLANDTWPYTVAPLIQVIPSGFGYLLRKIRDEYKNPPVYITEIGFGDLGGSDDYDRIQFHYDYISELLLAVKRDGCDVRKYTVWSLIDVYEWIFGFTLGFGIVSVNTTSPSRERSAKLSTKWWRDVMRERALQNTYTNDSRYHIYKPYSFYRN